MAVAEPSVAELRQRMAQVRAELFYDSQRLRENAQTLTDWRYYVRRYPWVTLGASAAIGYLLIPKRRMPQPPVDAEAVAKLLQQHRLEVRPPSAAPGLLQSLTSTLGSALLKAGLTYLAHWLGQSLSTTAAGAQAGPHQEPSQESRESPAHSPASDESNP
jgi:hypothetical protein